MARKNYDFAIIGGGLSGWLVARALSNTSKYHIAILEGQTTWGGNAHTISTPFGIMSSGLKFIPDSEKSHEAIDFLESILKTDLGRERFHLPPLTLEKGQLQTFIGFGEKAPSEIDELSYYLSSERLKFKVPIEEWISLLQRSFVGDSLNKSQVTDFEVENDKVKALMINGNHRLEADHFIFCGFPADIIDLLPAGTMDPRSVQKIAKNKWWTSVSLNLIHKTPPTDVENLHVITGGSDLFTTLGYFHQIQNPQSENAPAHTVSQWLSLIASDAADEETEATALREMKRLIKRAYPNALDEITHERIAVNSNSHGSLHVKLTERMTLPGFENLSMATGSLHSQKNLVGTLLQAKEVFEAIQKRKASLSPTTDSALG